MEKHAEARVQTKIFIKRPRTGAYLEGAEGHPPPINSANISMKVRNLVS